MGFKIPHGQTLTIKGPRQFGKSSMLSRTLQAAEQANKKVVHLNFQELDQENRADAHKFFRHFCSWIADELQIDHQIIGSQLGLVWGSGRTDIQCCTHYVERHILKLFNKSIVLAMDEVDSILECPFHIDFFPCYECGMISALQTQYGVYLI